MLVGQTCVLSAGKSSQFPLFFFGLLLKKANERAKACVVMPSIPLMMSCCYFSYTCSRQANLLPVQGGAAAE